MEIDASVRDATFFSAKVSDAKLLEQMRDYIGRAAAGERGFHRGDFVKKMRTAMGVPAGEKLDPNAPVTDLRSSRRLELIYDFQRERLDAELRAKQAQDPDFAYEYPAQELIRVEEREVPRDWEARWRAAGGKFYEGRMIALRDDPIWAKISRFGSPLPPFDFNSGMGLEDIDRDEAISLGLIRDDDADGRKEDVDDFDEETPPSKSVDPGYEKFPAQDIFLQYDTDTDRLGTRYDSETVRKISAQVKALGGEARNALRIWSDMGYKRVGQYYDELESGKNPEKPRIVRELEKAFDEAPGFPESLQVLRTAEDYQVGHMFGMKAGEVSRENVFRTLESLLGKDFTCPRFPACGIGGEVKTQSQTPPYRFVIDVPEGAKAIFLAPVSEVPKEEEVLIGNNQKFVLRGWETRRTTQGEVTYIHLELFRPKE